MATLELKNYIPASDSASILGYCTLATATGGYSLFKAQDATFGNGVTVATIQKASTTVDVNLSTEAAFSDGKVTGITGDSDHAWSIVGSNANSATLTTINTGAKNDVVKMTAMNDGATINTGDGNDSISLVTANGTLTVEAGAGDDSVSLGTVNGALTINAGDGTNRVSVGTANSTLSYTGGVGNDSVNITEKVAGNADFALGSGANLISVKSAEGNVNITGGEGADTVDVTKADGNVTISIGDGANRVSVADAGGSLSITTGAGKDSISIGHVGKDATINLGDGADSLTFQSGQKIEGALNISASGTSANVIDIQSSAIEGNVNISLGDGADRLSITSATATVSGSISLGEGKDSVVLGALDKATITSGAGNKTMSVAGAESASITLGAGADTVSLGDGTKKIVGSTIDLGDGKDSLLINSKVEESTINLGNGNDFVSIGADMDSSTINLGDGNDTVSIDSHALKDVTITGGAGKDVFSLGGLNGGTVTLTDFDVTTDKIYGVGTFAVDRFKSDGTFSVSGSGTVALTGDSFAITDDNDLHIAWAGESGTTIDASSFSKEAILIGSDNDDVSDTLIGGSKKDSIFAGSGDYVYGGAGNDSISLGGTEAAYVGFSKNGGKDSVSGFRNNSTKEDVVVLFENSVSDLSKITTTATDTTLKMGTATLTLEGTKTFRIKDNTGSDYKVTAVDSTTTWNSLTSVDDMADVYYAADVTGAKKLDFSNVNDRLVVDLGNTGRFTNSNNSQYYGKFTDLTGGKDDSILMGSANATENITAGIGNATIWGGGSKSDTLAHGVGSDNTVTYVYGAGDGKDTISSTNSNWGSADSDDVLWLNNAEISSVKNNGTDTTITLSSTGDKLTLAGLKDANTAIKYTTDGNNISKVKVGISGKANSFTYEEGVSAYVGGANNSLTVGSDVDTATIMLDGSAGQTFEGIKSVDAHNNTGSLIIGGSGSVNETLTAGRGDTSLWGGAGSSNDTLVGTTGGTTEYYFGYGNGSDVIQNSHSDDKVVLYNVALSDGAEVDTSSSNKIVVTLNDGSKLTVNNVSTTSVNTFQLTDSSWEWNASTKEWTQVK